eukprot:jgi/Tetstr1/453115/TSEL_040138.t1
MACQSLFLLALLAPMLFIALVKAKATLDALSERGCYKQWDEYNMEAALQDLAEQCHVKSIRDRVVENLDPKRWDVKEEQVKSQYDILADLYKKYPDLPANNIANLDETNLTPERRKSKVLAAKGARRTHTLINDQRFSMTILPCVFANGEYMPPHFVVPGKIRPEWWTKDKELKQIMKTGVFKHATLSV